ncbi:DUF4238 domain-containing protein [Pseudomonas brassicacearum]|uniref:DUF4238 domain-containing protein n=1 Tax=Pseudomonas brassicacearum TaxID=930166 RepID=UPI001D3AEE63|nr:DUF4238 domain-containing protein [Pseudomonas brassicacearum]CAH0144075.1 hypothetical protein SRABI06_00541 [Pseudomonas brassicacearum]
MSGSRHHFIPKFLQKGFSSRSTSTDVYCWCFPKGAKAFQPNIKNVGIESLFYSISSETELDDVISKEEEHNFSPLIDKLRANSVGEDDSINISAMLAHLEVRSQHFRSSANVLFSELMGTLLNTFSSLDFLQDTLTKILSPDSPIFQKALLEAGISKDLYRQISKSNPEGLKGLKENMARGVSKAIYERRNTMPDLIAKAIKDGHIRLLNQSISPEKRASRYTNLKYSLQNYPANDLPLGDSMTLFHVNGERKFKPFLDKEDKLISAILPLSPNQYLIGSTSESKTVQYPSLALEVARCSFAYFISSRNDDQAKSYQSEIGENSHWLRPQDIHQIFADSLEKILCEY